MTFKGSGLDDLEKILHAFPMNFTIEDVTAYFQWPVSRARQAIVNGQQTDILRVIQETRQPNGTSGYAIYENTRWRKQWLTRAWGNCDVRESDMASDRQEHG